MIKSEIINLAMEMCAHCGARAAVSNGGLWHGCPSSSEKGTWYFFQCLARDIWHYRPLELDEYSTNVAKNRFKWDGKMPDSINDIWAVRKDWPNG